MNVFATLVAREARLLFRRPAELLNPLADNQPTARFLAYRSPNAAQWHGRLSDMGVVTDVRGDVLRIGFGLYQTAAEVEALAACFRQL